MKCACGSVDFKISKILSTDAEFVAEFLAELSAAILGVAGVGAKFKFCAAAKLVVKFLAKVCGMAAGSALEFSAETCTALTEPALKFAVEAVRFLAASAAGLTALLVSEFRTTMTELFAAEFLADLAALSVAKFPTGAEALFVAKFPMDAAVRAGEVKFIAEFKECAAASAPSASRK